MHACAHASTHASNHASTHTSTHASTHTPTHPPLSTKQYQGPGSKGHVRRDAAWMAAAGADFVKVDSCCGSQQRDEAIADYAEVIYGMAVCPWEALILWEEEAGRTHPAPRKCSS